MLMDVGTKGARCTAHGADKEMHALMQKLGALNRHQAALIVLSVVAHRQVASGPLSEMIQNNSACQEERGRALKAEVV